MYKAIVESGAGGGTYVEANPTLTGGEESLTAIQIGAEKFAIEGGGGGVSDYTELENKPTINSVELNGDKTSSDLGLAPASHTHTASDVSGLAGVATSGSYSDLSNKPTKLSDFTNDVKEVNVGTTEPVDESVEIFIDESEDYVSGIPSASQGGATLPDYSTTEYKIERKWIDGKDIWEKVIEFGALPNSTTKKVPLNISFDKIISLQGMAGNFPLPCPRQNPTYGIDTFIDGSDLTITTGTDRSSLTGYVTIQYTKPNN